LRGYDYTTPGSYFVSIVTHRPPLRSSCCHQNLDGKMLREGRRMCMFGVIVGGVMRVNELGEIIRAELLKTAAIRSEIALDEFVIMPNHVHAILSIVGGDNGSVGADGRPPLRE
jgi:putative transposase